MHETVYSVAIRELPSEDRPRERLASFGPQSLSTQELLAIILRTGTPSRSVLRVAEDLLHRHGGLRGIATATLRQLGETRGVGSVKAIELAACFELGKRLSALPEQARPEISSPEDAANLVMADMRYLPVETFRALLLDAKNRLIRVERVSVGILDSAIVHPREVFHAAVVERAAGVVVVHNHPSGDPNPSAEDRNVTQRLVEAGRLLGVDLIDHLIIGDGRWLSLRRQGVI